MKVKIIFRWISEKINAYNLFMPEENDYDDNNDVQQDPIIVLKHQKYTTRLYVLMLMCKLNIIRYLFK